MQLLFHQTFKEGASPLRLITYGKTRSRANKKGVPSLHLGKGVTEETEKRRGRHLHRPRRTSLFPPIPATVERLRQGRRKRNDDFMGPYNRGGKGTLSSIRGPSNF